MYRQTDLIEQIKQKPILWDGQYKHNANKDLRDMQWIEVANALFPNWAALHLAERNEKLYEIKRRWKNIRDYHRKEGKKWVGKKYMYKDLLKFLDYQDVTINSEIIVKNEVCLDPTDLYGQEIIAGTEENLYGGITAPTVQCPMSAINQKLPALDEVEPGPPKKRMHTDDDNIDEDKSFLLSLLPEMRKLDGRQKIDFKISVLNELREARYSAKCIEMKEEIPG